MDILFLCHRIPYPPNKGDKIRSHALLKELAKHHRVHLGCFVDDPSDLKHLETVRQLAGGECRFIPIARIRKWLSAAQAVLSGQPVTTAYFGNRRLTSWIDHVVVTRNIERAVVFSSAMAPYVLDSARLDPGKAILDMVDVDSDKWRQYSEGSTGPQRWIYSREATLLFRVECRAARRFKATILSSRLEAETFAALAPESVSRIKVINNGVNRDYFCPGNFADPFPPGEQPIVMTGKMDYLPNVDGAKWFFKKVMGLVARELPAARFYLVGASPAGSLRALAGPKLVLCGHVPDVRPYLHHAAAVVAPLRIARGVQNKVLEAMAMAKPLVVTPAASRALTVTSGEHLWIEDSPAGFAASVVAAVKGPDRLTIARNARDYVTRHHDWTRNLAGLAELIADSNDLRAATEDVCNGHRSRQDTFDPGIVRPSVWASS